MREGKKGYWEKSGRALFFSGSFSKLGWNDFLLFLDLPVLMTAKYLIQLT